MIFATSFNPSAFSAVAGSLSKQLPARSLAAMTYKGTVTEEHTVALRPEVKLPPGTTVEVTIQGDSHSAPAAVGGETLYDALKDFIGCMDDGRTEGSYNVDHYLYGAKKHETP